MSHEFGASHDVYATTNLYRGLGRPRTLFDFALERSRAGDDSLMDELREQVYARSDEAHEARRRAAGPPGPVPSVVYYVRFADRVKIGVTKNLRSRLCGGVPYDELLAVEPGAREVERLRHEQFAEARVKGEWFEMSDALIAHIDQLRRQAGEPDPRDWPAARAQSSAVLRQWGPDSEPPSR